MAWKIEPKAGILGSFRVSATGEKTGVISNTMDGAPTMLAEIRNLGELFIYLFISAALGLRC